MSEKNWVLRLRFVKPRGQKHFVLELNEQFKDEAECQLRIDDLTADMFMAFGDDQDVEIHLVDDETELDHLVSLKELAANADALARFGLAKTNFSQRSKARQLMNEDEELLRSAEEYERNGEIDSR